MKQRTRAKSWFLNPDVRNAVLIFRFTVVWRDTVNVARGKIEFSLLFSLWES